MDDGKLTENKKYNRKEVVRLKINIFQFLIKIILLIESKLKFMKGSTLHKKGSRYLHNCNEVIAVLDRLLHEDNSYKYEWVQKGYIFAKYSNELKIQSGRFLIEPSSAPTTIHGG